jgi:hypothetical protein
LVGVAPAPVRYTLLCVKGETLVSLEQLANKTINNKNGGSVAIIRLNIVLFLLMPQRNKIQIFSILK